MNDPKQITAKLKSKVEAAKAKVAKEQTKKGN